MDDVRNVVEMDLVYSVYGAASLAEEEGFDMLEVDVKLLKAITKLIADHQEYLCKEH